MRNGMTTVRPSRSAIVVRPEWWIIYSRRDWSPTRVGRPGQLAARLASASDQVRPSPSLHDLDHPGPGRRVPGGPLHRSVRRPRAVAARPRRGRVARPGRRRPLGPPALFVLLVGTAVLYLVGLGASGWANAFYSAAVQAGTTSWKAFFFGSFDASQLHHRRQAARRPVGDGALGADLRLQLLEHAACPQALEGVAARRPAVRHRPALVLARSPACWPAPSLALTPVAALMFRFNNPDALLVLLLVAAAYATVRALEDGRDPVAAAGRRRSSASASSTKMLQAFLVLPGVRARLPDRRRRPTLLPPDLAGPGRRRSRSSWSAGWWVAVVRADPGRRTGPYIGGSTNNSVLRADLRLQRPRPADRQRDGQRRRRRQPGAAAGVGRDRLAPAVRHRAWAARSPGCCRPR